MSLRHPKEITIEAQTKKVTDRILRYKEELAIVEKVLPIIKKFEGKEISKRIATAIQKEIPEYRVRYNLAYGMYHIEFSRLDKWEKVVGMLIGYESSNAYIQKKVILEQIINFNQCYLLNKDRIKKLETGLSVIAELVDKRNKIIELSKELFNMAEAVEQTYDYDFES